MPAPFRIGIASCSERASRSACQQLRGDTGSIATTWARRLKSKQCSDRSSATLYSANRTLLRASTPMSSQRPKTVSALSSMCGGRLSRSATSRTRGIQETSWVRCMKTSHPYAVYDVDARRRLLRLLQLANEWTSVLHIRGRSLEELLARTISCRCRVTPARRVRLCPMLRQAFYRSAFCSARPGRSRPVRR
jgi:hypothetical protein